MAEPSRSEGVAGRYRDDPEATADSTEPRDLAPTNADAPGFALVLTTWIRLVLASCCFGIVVALSIFENVRPSPVWYMYSLRLVLQASFWTSVLVIFFDVVNLVLWRRYRKSAYVLLSFLIDTLFVFVIGNTVPGLGRFLIGCDRELDPDTCDAWINFLTPLVDISYALALLVGVVSAVLAIMRLVRLVQAVQQTGSLSEGLLGFRFPEISGPLRIPTGTISFEVRFRVLRQEPVASGADPRPVAPAHESTDSATPLGDNE